MAAKCNINMDNLIKYLEERDLLSMLDSIKTQVKEQQKL